MSQGWASSGNDRRLHLVMVFHGMGPSGDRPSELRSSTTHTRPSYGWRQKDGRGELGVMSLRDSQTETWRHSDATASGLGPLAKALIPTPHNSPPCLVEIGNCQETRAKRSERETEEARTGPNEKEEGHLSAKGDVCFFHRNRAGYGLTTGMTQRRHRSSRASTIPCSARRQAPAAFSLGLLGFLFASHPPCCCE